MEMIEWGQIVNTHGVRGEMKVTPWVDFLTLAPKVKAFLIEGKSYEIISVRGHKNMVLLTLVGVDSMDKAVALKNKVLATRRCDIDLGEGHYFYSDLYGFEVYDMRTQSPIGILDRIESLPANDVYVVKADTGEVLIPIVPAFDRGVSLGENRVNVCTIEGMLENDED